MASFALASRVRNYGGDLEIAPTISLLDDEFELVLFEGASSFTFLKYMLGVVVQRHQRMRGVTILRTRKAVFSAPSTGRIHLQVDGEYAGLAPGTVEIVPNALTLLVPPDSAPADPPASTTRHGQHHPHADRRGVEPRGLEPLVCAAGAAADAGSANIPDIDIVTAVRGALPYFEAHRGYHALDRDGARDGADSHAAGVRAFQPQHARMESGLRSFTHRSGQPSVAGLDQCLWGSIPAAVFVALVSSGSRTIIVDLWIWAVLLMACGGAAFGTAGQFRNRREIRIGPRAGYFRAVVPRGVRFRALPGAPARH